jgi:hypothetical protein
MEWRMISRCYHPEEFRASGAAWTPPQADGAPGRGTLEKDKPPILGLIQRGGQVVLRMLANVQQTPIQPIIESLVMEKQ